MWYQLYQKNKLVLDWGDFKNEIMSRYDTSESKDYFEKLLKGKQTDYVNDYYATFIKLVSKAGNV